MMTREVAKRLTCGFGKEGKCRPDLCQRWVPSMRTWAWCGGTYLDADFVDRDGEDDNLFNIGFIYDDAKKDEYVCPSYEQLNNDMHENPRTGSLTLKSNYTFCNKCPKRYGSCRG